MNFTNILGIDRGSKQIGLAYTKQGIVLPGGVLSNDGELYFSLAGIVAQHGIGQIIIGLPKNSKGANAVQRLICSLKAMIPDCEIMTIDEHYTTVIAQEILGNYDKRKGFDDCVAAMQILERFLRKEI